MMSDPVARMVMMVNHNAPEKINSVDHPVGSRLLVVHGTSGVGEAWVTEWSPNGQAVQLRKPGHEPCWNKACQVDVFDVLDPNGGDWTAPDILHG
jgi:hypothetical protein